MATWAKEHTPLIPIKNRTTGSTDSTSHTIVLQPKNLGAGVSDISCSQCTTELWNWRSDSDLDAEIDYWIVVDTDQKGSLSALNGITMIGG